MTERTKPAAIETMTMPDQDVVTVCRNLLRMAESGEMRSIAACGQVTGFRGFRSFASSYEADQVALVGEVELLKHQLMTDKISREQEG